MKAFAVPSICVPTSKQKKAFAVPSIRVPVSKQK